MNDGDLSESERKTIRETEFLIGQMLDFGHGFSVDRQSGENGMDGQHLQNGKPPLKLFDPTQAPPAGTSSAYQPNETAIGLIAWILLVAGVVAATGVLAMACRFLHWSLLSQW